MKVRREAAALALCLLGLTACSKLGGGAGGGRTLHIYNWTGYISDEMVKKFEKEQGIQVSVDTFDNNETLMAKLQSGASDYDLTVVSAEFIPILKADRLIQKINASTLTGYQNLEHRWKVQGWDFGNAYSIPWHWGITSYMVDTKVYNGPLDSLSLLFAPPPALRGRVGMFSSPTEVISLALTYLGQPLCNDKAARAEIGLRASSGAEAVRQDLRLFRHGRSLGLGRGRDLPDRQWTGHAGPADSDLR